MTNLKKIIPTKLLWIDLEMTGLDPQKDVIIEVAAEVTDFDFKTLGSYESLVGQPKKVLAERMQANVWWKDYPENRDNFLKNVPNAPSAEQVEQDLIRFVEEHFGNEPAVLAGNSIHNDKKFIEKWWPGLDLKLHYRMLDVSSLKVLMQGQGRGEYAKKDIHRAFDDIQASIAELQFYLEKLKQG
jgi:oligoribonuclease